MFIILLLTFRERMDEQVILVDEQDNPIGLMPKLEAHQKALLHNLFLYLSLTKKEN